MSYQCHRSVTTIPYISALHLIFSSWSYTSSKRATYRWHLYLKVSQIWDTYTCSVDNRHVPHMCDTDSYLCFRSVTRLRICVNDPRCPTHNERTHGAHPSRGSHRHHNNKIAVTWRLTDRWRRLRLVSQTFDTNSSTCCRSGSHIFISVTDLGRRYLYVSPICDTFTYRRRTSATPIAERATYPWHLYL